MAPLARSTLRAVAGRDTVGGAKAEAEATKAERIATVFMMVFGMI
jgi:hypothetical protein